jgi:Domain of unknown function (DUF4167)
MMRNGQNKRMRGRNRNNNNNNNNNSHHHHNRGHHHNPLTRVYESNGPDVKIRGTAHHIAEKYLQLARDATSVGDHVTAEAHHQHAEHYLRLIAAAQEQFRQQNPNYQPQAAPSEQNMDGNSEDGGDDTGQPGQQQPQQNFNNQQPNFQQQPQPYNGGGQPSYGGGQQPQQQQPQYNRPQHQPQPQYQPPPQQTQPQPQVQPQQSSGNDVGGLPSFITGGQPVQAPQYGSNNGQDGQGDRFNRRRRHRGPRPPGQENRGDAQPEPGNE